MPAKEIKANGIRILINKEAYPLLKDENDKINPNKTKGIKNIKRLEIPSFFIKYICPTIINANKKMPTKA